MDCDHQLALNQLYSILAIRGFSACLSIGRFYAHNLLKIIFARIVENYDIKMPGNVEGIEARYPMVEHGNVVMEPRDKPLLLRRIKSHQVHVD